MSVALLTARGGAGTGPPFCRLLCADGGSALALTVALSSGLVVWMFSRFASCDLSNVIYT